MTAANPSPSPSAAAARPATAGGPPRGGRQQVPTIDPVRVLRQHAKLLGVAAVAGATRYTSNGAASDRCSACADSRTTTGFVVLHSIASCVT
jgi:hypothetical protein